MNWTTKPPSKPGWYWIQRQYQTEPEIARVVHGQRFQVPQLVVWLMMFSFPLGLHDATTIVEWSDEPIPMPREPKEEGK